MPRKQYLLVDARCALETPEPFRRHHSECSIYTVADTLGEAVEDHEAFPDAVLVECDVLREPSPDGRTPGKLSEGKVIPWPEGA